MNYRYAFAPARLVRCLGAAFAVSLTAGLAAAPAAYAQQAPAQAPAAKPATPAKPPAKPPAAKPATPAKPAQAQAPAQPAQAQGEQQKLQLIYSPWVKVCGPDQVNKDKKTCATMKDGRIESGMMVIHAVIVEQDGQPQKLLRVTLPYGVNLQVGTRLIIDQEPPLTAPYVTCIPPVVAVAGCVADYQVTDEIIGKMKTAKNLLIQAIHVSQEPMNLPLPLIDFAKAYDGPPTDPQAFEEQQKKLQDELQKRAEEARKNLEAQQQQGAAAKK